MRNATKVVRARAPLRLGLAGGGTDLSPYCDQYGGAVLNATIDRYAFAFIEPSGDGTVQFVARDLGIEERLPCEAGAVAGARLAIHAGVYARMIRDYCAGKPMPLKITTSVDAPPGSGLGSSSALSMGPEATTALMTAIAIAAMITTKGAAVPKEIMHTTIAMII